MTRDLHGRTVAVTGAARGIGLATAHALTAAGARVALGDLEAQLAASAAAEVGGGAVGLELDVTDRASFNGFLDAAESALGPLDVLVNNAGIMPLGPLLEEPDELTRRIMEVNLFGPVTGMKLAGPRMAGRGSGHIVNVASAVGRVALAHAATYSASKHALIGMSQALRSELRDTGVEVSVIVPMIVSTELGAGLSAVRGQPTVTAEAVADAIVGVVARPRFETWVPRSGRRLFRAMGLMPDTWAEGVGRAIGAADVLARPDAAARAEYEKRARG